MQNPQGYFYITVFDKWSKSPAQREICSYSTQGGLKSDDFQAGFRQGGGVAIAALAAAARLLDGNTATRLALADSRQSAAYLQAAETGYWHLAEINTRYLDDGRENIIDEYCALLAAVELFRATEDTRYLEAAKSWATRLAARQMSDSGRNWCLDRSRPVVWDRLR